MFLMMDPLGWKDTNIESVNTYYFQLKVLKDIIIKRHQFTCKKICYNFLIGYQVWFSKKYKVGVETRLSPACTESFHNFVIFEHVWHDDCRLTLDLDVNVQLLEVGKDTLVRQHLQSLQRARQGGRADLQILQLTSESGCGLNYSLYSVKLNEV